MSRPQNCYQTQPWPPKKPIRALKSKKNDPKIKSKSKVRIEGTIEKNFFKYISRRKTVFEPYPKPKNSQLGPQKLKNDTKLKSNSNVRIEGIIENESCSFELVDPYPNPKNNPLGPQKFKNDPKIQSKSKVKIEGNLKNTSCSTSWVDSKPVFAPYSDPKNKVKLLSTVSKYSYQV